MNNKVSRAIRWAAVTAMILVTVGMLAAQTQDKIVAIVDGKQITQKDLDATIASQLLPLEQQIFALRKAALENLIVRAVLGNAAAKKGIPIDEFKKQLTAGKVEISAAEVEQVYSENATVFGAMSPDEAKERLRLDLESQARMKLYRDALAEMRKASRIEVRLEEPKLPSVVSDIGTAPVTGSKNATVTIVEFSDFQCPFCRGSQSTLKQVLKDYGKDVRLVFKHLPLEMHASAFASAQAAYCAGEQGSFWQYQDALFASENLSNETLNKTASRLGLDTTKFSSCMNSEASRTAILKDVDEAKRLGINSTPTFIINGKLFRGTPSLEDFQALIQSQLKTAQNTSLPGQP